MGMFRYWGFWFDLWLLTDNSLSTVNIWGFGVNCLAINAASTKTWDSKTLYGFQCTEWDLISGWPDASQFAGKIFESELSLLFLS